MPNPYLRLFLFAHSSSPRLSPCLGERLLALPCVSPRSPAPPEAAVSGSLLPLWENKAVMGTEEAFGSVDQHLPAAGGLGTEAYPATECCVATADSRVSSAL